MKKSSIFLRLGAIGLGISLAIGILMNALGISYPMIPFVIPWFSFSIIGWAKWHQEKRNEE